jgi:hypothetical protein
MTSIENGAGFSQPNGIIADLGLVVIWGRRLLDSIIASTVGNRVSQYDTS